MKKYTRVIVLLLIAVLLCGCLNLEASASDLGDSLNGTWYFTSYEYLKYISTPDRQKLHVQVDIDDSGIMLQIDRDGTTEIVETTYFFNNGGINFSIENDASYLLEPDENGNLFMYGSEKGKKFPGFKYIFSREPAAPDPAIGSNPDYWWEGDWVIYHAYDREKMENSAVEGRLSFGAYLDTDVNYAKVCFPDGTISEYTYDFLPDLMLLNDNDHISVQMGENGIGSFSYGGVDYSFARTVPAQPEKEERFYDVNVFIHDADNREFITYGTAARVSLDNTPQTLPEDLIPQTFEYNGHTYFYDPAVCTAAYNHERHGYEVYMKLKEEPTATEEPAATGEAYIPVNPWLYTGDNFESILKSLIAQRDWSPDYTFDPSNNSFTVYDGAGKAMPGSFRDEGDGGYSAAITMGGVERILYADDFHGYATEWDKLTVDAKHEYLDSLIQAMIRKEEKESWWIELNDDGASGIAEDRDDNEVPFTYEFALTEEGEEYVKLTYNEKTIDNISLRK